MCVSSWCEQCVAGRLIGQPTDANRLELALYLRSTDNDSNAVAMSNQLGDFN
jgi:hypothetical protein